MSALSRRALLGALLAAPAVSRAQAAPRLVVVGGGFGGASAARFARAHAPDVAVTLIEPQPRFITCPYGNLVLGGVRRMEDITHGYEGLAARGVRIVADRVVGHRPGGAQPAAGWWRYARL